MHALIDGDILVYRVGFASQEKHYRVWAPGAEEEGPLGTFSSKKEAKALMAEDEADCYLEEVVVPDTKENCLHSVKLMLNSVLEEVRPEEHTVYLSGSNNFRYEVAPYYKQSRKEEDKPYHYETIRKYLLNVWNAQVVDDMEADDAMGITQWEDYAYRWPGKATPDGAGTIICTIDKDLDMIPGWHYNFISGEKYWVDEWEGLQNFYIQLLTGDSTDDIPGIYKITGQKATAKLKKYLKALHTETLMWELVKGCYIDALATGDETIEEVEEIEMVIEDKLVEIGRLLWILRNPKETFCGPWGCY